MKSECKDLHPSITLPSISDAPFLPAVVRKAGDEAKAEPWRRRAIQDDSPDLDQEARARHQAQLEQRHLEAYRNMHRLRDSLYRRYAALLRDKVHSQRLELQQRYEASRAKSENQTKQKQRKLAISKLQHNDSYLKSIPKTSYYLIFDLQKQLAERGHLKTHHDLEDFYRCIKYSRHSSQLLKSLEDVRKKILESRSAADSMIKYKMSEKHPSTAVNGGHEDHIAHSRLLEQGSDSGESSGELIFSGSQEKDGFPKMKARTFATLQPNFMRNFQSKMPDLIVPEIPEKSRKAEIYVRRLREMHDLCLANMAFSKRLLDRQTDSLCWQEERGDHDLATMATGRTEQKITSIHSLFLLPVIDSRKEKTSQANRPPLCSPRHQGSVQDDRPSCPQQLSRLTSASSHRCFETLVWDTAVCCRETPDPLSIEDVCQQKHVEIIDRGFKLWRKYKEDTDQ